METRHEARLLRLPEVAERLAIGRSTLYEMIGTGEVPTIKIGRAVRVHEEDLFEYVEGLRKRREASTHA